MLVVESHGRLAVAGFPNLRPIPDRKQGEWERDNLADIFIGKPHPHSRDSILALLRAVGGALPVTVEGLNGSDLYFSRRNQSPMSYARPGKISVGVIRGLYRQRDIMMRRGGGILRLTRDQLVSGLPAALCTAAVEALRTSFHPIWFVGEGNEVNCSLASEKSQEFDVLPVSYVVTEKDGTSLSGVLCQSVNSLRLYWLPSAEVGWTKVSVHELAALFGEPVASGGNPKVFTVSLIESGAVSIRRRARVLKEFAELWQGREVLIRVLATRERTVLGQLYLAQTRSTDTALEFLSAQNLDLPANLPGEISRRTHGDFPAIQVTDVNGRRFEIDLSVGICEGYTSNEPRPAFDAVLMRMRRKASIEVGFYEANPNKIDLAVAEILLVEAWKLIRERGAWRSPEWAAIAANRWLALTRKAHDMELHFALMSALVLHRIPIGHANAKIYNTQAIGLIREMGWRALRSKHVEVIERYRMSGRSNPFGFTERVSGMLTGLCSSMTDSRRLDRSQLHDLTQLIWAADLQGDRWARGFEGAVIDALRRCAGDLDSRNLVSEHSPLMNKLVSVWRSLPYSSYVADHLRLQDDQINELRAVLETIMREGIDLRLPPAIKLGGDPSS